MGGGKYFAYNTATGNTWSKERNKPEVLSFIENCELQFDDLTEMWNGWWKYLVLAERLQRRHSSSLIHKSLKNFVKAWS